jgi:hypothetical protein
MLVERDRTPADAGGGAGYEEIAEALDLSVASVEPRCRERDGG